MPRAVPKIKAMSTGRVPFSGASSRQKIDGNLAGFGHVAALVDWSIAKHASLQPIAVSHFKTKSTTVQAILEGRKSVDELPVISRNEMLRYIVAVEMRANKYAKLQTAVNFTKLTGGTLKKQQKKRSTGNRVRRVRGKRPVA